jgi:histidinol-phosphate aminotransferase
VVALDEAYVHYTENPYGIGLLHRFPNLLVLQTLSKAYGLAGLRVGFGISANRNLILPMRHIKPTWNMGQMQIAGGIAGLSDDEHVARTVKTIVEMRAYVAQRMQGLSAFRMVPGSGANFFLTEISKPGLDSTLVFNELLKRGVIVKDGSDIIALAADICGWMSISKCTWTGLSMRWKTFKVSELITTDDQPVASFSDWH